MLLLKWMVEFYGDLWLGRFLIGLGISRFGWDGGGKDKDWIKDAHTGTYFVEVLAKDIKKYRMKFIVQ